MFSFEIPFSQSLVIWETYHDLLPPYNSLIPKPTKNSPWVTQAPSNLIYSTKSANVKNNVLSRRSSLALSFKFKASLSLITKIIPTHQWKTYSFLFYFFIIQCLYIFSAKENEQQKAHLNRPSFS